LPGLNPSSRETPSILPPNTRVAIPEGGGFRIEEIASDDFADFRDEVTGLLSGWLQEKGVPFPGVAVREILDNLIHAVPCNASVAIDPDLGYICISDNGPGIRRLDLALELGYSTATDDQRRLIRGAGVGFHLAREDMRRLGGELTVSSEPGLGTHVRLSFRPSGPRGVDPEEFLARLSQRQNNILFLLSEGESFGPSRVASELGISVSTAHRELTRLQELGLVSCAPDGKRFLSDAGKTYLQGLLSL